MIPGLIADLLRLALQRWVMCPNCPATKSDLTTFEATSDVGLLGRQIQLSAKKNSGTLMLGLVVLWCFFKSWKTKLMFTCTLAPAREKTWATSRCFDQPSPLPSCSQCGGRIQPLFQFCRGPQGSILDRDDRLAQLETWINMDLEYSVKVKSFASYKCLVSPSPWGPCHLWKIGHTSRSELRYCTRFCCLTDFLLVLRVPALAASTWDVSRFIHFFRTLKPQFLRSLTGGYLL